MKNGYLLPSMILAAGLLLAAAVFGLFFYQSRQKEIKVTAHAEFNLK